MPTVLISSGVPMRGFALPPEFQIEYPGEGLAFSKEEMLLRLPRTDVILACNALDAEMIQQGQNLKLIVCYGAGYDNIKIDAATALGIPVVNIPDTVTEATAELAISMLLCLSRRICELNHRMHQTDFQAVFGMGKHMGLSLKGMSLGIVGMGRIGSRVADFGRFMGMNILYASRQSKPEQEALGAIWCDLETLIQSADFISLHCPHTPETDCLINQKLLSQMKPTAYLINTARGRVIDEPALLEVLQRNQIAGAALDVFENEPHIRSEWSRLPNVLLTPHIGSNTVQAREGMIAAVCQCIKTVFAGQKPSNLLNPQVWKDR